MSCYKLEPHDPDFCTVRVGYDAGLRSFYAYIARPMVTKLGKVVGLQNGHVIEYKGTTPDEIRTLEQLEAIVSPYAKVNDDVWEYLLSDVRRAETPPDACGGNKEIKYAGKA